ncbi:SAM-dependent methyltransferase [Gammaproteobacteria bacterium]
MKSHWERVYSSKSATSVSWFQARAEVSLRLIRETGVAPTAAIIDVGGGASTLVDDLLANGYSHLSVLDLAASALDTAKDRLGSQADAVGWIEGDVTQVALPAEGFDLWHDRAVFHFMTSPQSRADYVRILTQALKPGGHAIIATFAQDGPPQCSELPVMRYDATALSLALGTAFVLTRHELESHQTPKGQIQPFVYCHFRKAPSSRRSHHASDDTHDNGL